MMDSSPNLNTCTMTINQMRLQLKEIASRQHCNVASIFFFPTMFSILSETDQNI